MPNKAGVAALTVVASKLADELYPKSPKISNELLNRIKPSTNAIAAQKALLKCMVEGLGQERLGIVGFPAHGGLYASSAGENRIYGSVPDSTVYQFKTPPASGAAALKLLWDAADKLLKTGNKAGQSLQALFNLWQAPPYGLRDGLFPVFAIAYILSRSESLAVYLDDVFQPKLTSLLTDRLSQDPACIRLRWSSVSDYHRRILTGVGDVVAKYSGMEGGTREPLEIARGLVGVVDESEAMDTKNHAPFRQCHPGSEFGKGRQRPKQIHAGRYPSPVRQSQSRPRHRGRRSDHGCRSCCQCGKSRLG